jgi:hypothetical protein
MRLFRRDRCCGWSTLSILRVVCGGFRSGSYVFSGYNVCVVLHAFLSFSSLPICLSPAREIDGFGVTCVVVSCLVSLIGHILVAMSW